MRRNRRGRARTVLAAVTGICVVFAVVVAVLTVAAPSARTTSAPRAAAGATPAPEKTAPAPRPDPLGAAAATYVATRSGTVLAAVYDLDTGESWRLGRGRPQAEASVVKLDILETLLASDGMSPARRPLARRMIEDSDNDAATALWHAAGGQAGIGGYNAAAGLTQTTPSSCVECPGFPWPGWGLTTTTPVDQIALLRDLVLPGGPLSAGARSYALSLMENVTPSQRWGVSGGVPDRVAVALKNGWLPLDDADTDWQVNSVGWISGDGRDYLIAVLTTGNPDERYGIDTISGLSSIVWRQLGAASWTVR